MPRRQNQLPPRYEHTPEDIERANQAWTKTRLPAGDWPLIDALNEALSRIPKLKREWSEPLNTGGTLYGSDLRAIKITDSRGDRHRLETYVAPVKTAVSELSGVDFTGTTLKAFGPDKVGLGPHRDANFAENKTAKTANLVLKGLGRYCLWVYPEECVYDGKLAIAEGRTPASNPMIIERMADADNPIMVEVGGRERALYPVQSIDMSPGDMIVVDETPGVGTWEGQGGPTKLLHSAYRIDDIRHILLLRSQTVSPLAA